MSEIKLNIDGMHCGGCVRRVSQALERIPSAEVIDVQIGSARVTASDPEQVVAALAKAGYSAHLES